MYNVNPFKLVSLAMIFVYCASQYPYFMALIENQQWQSSFMLFVVMELIVAIAIFVFSPFVNLAYKLCWLFVGLILVDIFCTINGYYFINLVKVFPEEGGTIRLINHAWGVLVVLAVLVSMSLLSWRKAIKPKINGNRLD